MNFFKNLLSTLFSIILWGLVIGLISFLSVRSFINKKSISDIIKSIDISEIFTDKDGNYNEVGREIHDELTKSGVPEDLVDDILDAEAISNFVADYASTAIDYIVYDSEFNKIKAKDIAKLINENIDNVFIDLRNRKVEGYELLTDDVLNEIKINVDSLADNVEKKLPDIKKDLKLDENQRVIEALRFSLSNVVVAIFIGVVAFISLIVILLNIKKCRFGYWVGITYILASFPFVFLFALSSKIELKSDMQYARDLVKYILNRFSLYGLIFFIIGLVFLIIGIIMGLRKNKKTTSNINNNYQTSNEQPVIVPTSNEPEPVNEDKTMGSSEPESIMVLPSEPPTSNEITNESYLYCVNCGAKLEPNQKFCYNCGESKE